MPTGTRQTETDRVAFDGFDPVRRIPVVALAGIIAVYLVILLVLPHLTAVGDMEYATFPDTESVWRNLAIPVAVSAAFACAVVTVLRWWQPVLVERRPVRRWVLVVPILFLVTILAGTDYATLADNGAAFTLSLLAGALLVGLGEEVMFRGITVTTFRAGRFAEARVALWSSLAFGLAHSVNVVLEGPGAFVQVLVTALAGYFFYLIRRATRGLLVPVLLHGLWDFALFSGKTDPDNPYPGAALFIVADLVLAIVLFVRRKKIELPATATATTTTAAGPATA
jgi:membrane protease YdiL (CAAX protease family)